jgi:hypothetical protein
MAGTRSVRTGTTTAARDLDTPGRSRSSGRDRRAPGRERTVVVICVSILATHLVDDDFVQPEPGSVAGSHLVSGLVPVLLLVATAACYPRLRAGGRAVVAITLGALGVAIGIPAAYQLRNGGLQADHYAGLLAGVAGVVLLRWAGDQDVLAGIGPLRERPDVEADRVGTLGFSIGGDMLRAAGQSDSIHAGVSKGAGESVGETDVSGIAQSLVDPSQAVIRVATASFSNHLPAPPIVEAISPRPVLLIYADPGIGGESTRQPEDLAAAGDPKAIWEVPGSSHTGGIDPALLEYEPRVVECFDQALLQTDTTVERNRE